ncbi:Fur family transcriptional regulator [Bacteroides propionicifaciens]|jgi:Fe2+ or Zn2+ uptake regulation protein|uniref:Fur family transcriptional regulator n=1 Tax=Bacteroides propionicifaciens TaxID=392838 RepID=UPI00037F3422|nr:transcriptional repressor [Bacteroides propionicifaciens]
MKALERLQVHNIKPSMQRIAIMDYLLENYTHPAVDEIYTALFPKIPTLSKTTVYNTLKLFEEHDAIKMLTIDDKNTCFDIDTSPHAHFFCKKCNKIEDFNLMKPEQLKGLDQSNHLVTEVHLYYKGVCQECLRSEE